ncbi:hypothetical protein BCF33_0968 [Hasllibacter halocynthiae]|uniref:DUF5076 domain-containing protein n=1 Tax=Hasllibacter halocynthiae TaxID=595589 RepID=A0A2T0X8S6_9RHOB|nr:hypothetical protein [Hasllibacter halocynthiae]PRY95350.1 hypothetical protein BCF33_0968 [Hasllibacter halocynthiae]
MSDDPDIPEATEEDLGPPVLSVFRVETPEGMRYGTGFDPDDMPDAEEAGAIFAQAMTALAVSRVSAGYDEDAEAVLAAIMEALGQNLAAEVQAITGPEPIQ